MSSSLETLLALGRAPSYWQHEMIHKTAWMATLSSSSTWTKELTAIQPTLNHEPLLGWSLATLTTSITRKNPPEEERQTRPGRARANGTTRHERQSGSNSETRPRVSKADFTAHRSSVVSEFAHDTSETPEHKKHVWTRQARPIDHAGFRSSGGPAQVKREVDYSLLHRWAGTSLSLASAERLRHQSIFPRREQRRHALAAPPMAVQQNSAASYSWQSSLIDQVRRVLYRGHQAAAMDAEQEELLLPQQWTTTIGESVVSLELLLHNAAFPGPGSAAKNGNMQDNQKSTLSSPTQGGRIPTKLNTIGSDSDRAETTRPMQRMQSVQQGSMQPLAQLLGGGNGLNSQTERRVPGADDQVEQIMPPVAASQLPSLVTSQSIDIPPLPVATATARMGARAEMNIEEDLDMLAAKIKRILDDEARRHGIDV